MRKKINDSKYLVQRPQYLVIIYIRNDKSAIGEGVDHISSLFVDFDSVKVPCFPGDFDTMRISREFAHPAELDVEFMND